MAHFFKLANFRAIKRYSTWGMLFPAWMVAQEVGIGTTAPAVRLDIQAPAAYGADLLRVMHGSSTYMIVSNAGRVGIGTSSPIARLHLANDGMIYAEGTRGRGDTIPDGPKVAFIWNPKILALRAGMAPSDEWDWDSVGPYSVAFGLGNVASGHSSAVVGGGFNSARAMGSAIGGGWHNVTEGVHSVVGGGTSNIAQGYAATIGGGAGNRVIGDSSVVGGGAANWVYGLLSAIGGGLGHTVGGDSSVIAGGAYNVITAYSAIVGGGTRNKAGGPYSFVGGGNSNVAQGAYSVVVGGARDTASGNYSFAVGRGLYARSYGEMALGIFNTDYVPNSYIGWDSIDRLLVVGNGMSDIDRSDAFVILKNGFTGISVSNPKGYLHVPHIDAGPNSPSDPASIIIGDFNGLHLELDGNEIHAMNGVNAATFYINADGGSVRIGSNSGDVQVEINQGGITYALNLPNDATSSIGQARANAWLQYSDERVKSDIQALRNALDMIVRLRPVYYFQHNSHYDPKSGEVLIDRGGAYRYGFLAQEMWKVVPEAVAKPEDETKDLWSVNYSQLIPILVKAVQEQQAMIAELQEAKARLESRVRALEVGLSAGKASRR